MSRQRSGVRLLRGMLILALVILVAISVVTGVIGLLAGLLLALLPVPIYVMLALWLDRFEPEPVPLLVRAFVWGAVAASFIALVLNSALAGLTDSDFVLAVATAPFVEELAKALVLFILFETERHEFDNVTDGLVYATMVGLGFAMTENILYYGEALLAGNLSMALFVRGAVFPYAHPLFTSMVGIGLGVAREMHGRRGTWLAPATGLILATALHALWNYAAGMDGATFWKMYLGLMVPLFLLVLWIAVRSLRRESEVIREHLTPFVGAGVLPAAELDCLCSVRSRLRTSIRTMKEHGRERWHRQRYYHRVVSELAFHRWRSARGLCAGELGAVREAYYLQEIRGFLEIDAA